MVKPKKVYTYTNFVEESTLEQALVDTVEYLQSKYRSIYPTWKIALDALILDDDFYGMDGYIYETDLDNIESSTKLIARYNHETDTCSPVLEDKQFIEDIKKL